jgi:hypothetical protein
MVSSIRQCDRDGGMFSTNQVGWGTGTFTIHRKYGDGGNYEESVKFDFCPACITDMTGAVRVPMQMLPGETREDLPRQTDRPLMAYHVRSHYLGYQM